MTRPLAAAARRLADQTSDRLDGLPADKIRILTVSAVTPGGSPGGNAVITLSWRGTDIAAKDYGAAYTPAVGDRVLCVLTSDNQLVVIDRLAG